MDARRFAYKLMEVECDSPEAKDAVAYMDKLLLRIFENPSYLNYLSGYQFLAARDVIELVFYRLPDDVMDELPLLVSKDAEFKQFEDVHGRPMLGVIIPSSVWKEEKEKDMAASNVAT